MLNPSLAKLVHIHHKRVVINDCDFVEFINIGVRSLYIAKRVNMIGTFASLSRLMVPRLFFIADLVATWSSLDFASHTFLSKIASYVSFVVVHLYDFPYGSLTVSQLPL